MYCAWQRRGRVSAVVVSEIVILDKNYFTFMNECAKLIKKLGGEVERESKSQGPRRLILMMLSTNCVPFQVRCYVCPGLPHA